MRDVITRLGLGMVLILMALMPLSSVAERPFALPPPCKGLAFSTEEDFVSQGQEPADGNPIISDGDLLGLVVAPSGLFQCIVCARNYDLLQQTFDVTVDLGLDAADVIDAESSLVAFSTELNSPHGNFTAGDLLVTNGVALPNVALTHLFKVGYDLGLDAVHFVGKLEAIRGFLDFAAKQSRSYWLDDPSRLSDTLTEFEVDIWFSTEGTFGPVTKPTFLDGDLLSARDGTIVAANANLLPAGVPAGIPDRGVDLGLDGVTGTRTGLDELDQVHFSTEILYAGQPSFTDGDALKYGGNVAYTNNYLVQCFEPRAKFLGLDALYIGPQEGVTRHFYLPLILKQ